MLHTAADGRTPAATLPPPLQATCHRGGGGTAHIKEAAPLDMVVLVGGGAVLHCSHLLDVVEHSADRIAILDQGKLLAEGSAAQLRERAGATEGARLDQVFRSLVQASDPAAAARTILG